MFNDFRQSHPVTFWVLAVGLVLVVLWAIGGRIFGVSAASTQSTVVAGPTDAQVSAASNLSIAQLQSSSDAAARADALTLQEDTLGVQYKIAQLDSAQQTNLDTLNYNYGVSALNAQTQQVGIAAGVQNHSTDAALAQAEAVISGNVAQQQILSNTQIAISTAANKTARAQATSSSLGSLFGDIFSIFSDARLKENLAFSHVDDRTGLTWYSFNYTENARRLLRLPRGRFVGVMAQDLIDNRKFSFAVTRHASGFLTVNYSVFGGAELAKQRTGLEIA